MSKRASLLVMSLLCLTLITTVARSADEKPKDDQAALAALAKASQNPVASLISVPFENNATFNNGRDDDFVNILNVKPVIPMSLSENWNLINRIITPVIYSEQSAPGDSAKFGIGDITYQAFFSPAKPGKLIWGIGPQLNLPTGMERFTSDQWSLGPNVVLLTMPGP